MNQTTHPNLLLPGLSLWQREMVRFFRQRNRVVGALVTPIVFWLLLGLGLGTSFRSSDLPAGHGYLEYFYAGTLLMILLFTAIFSTISVIEDRKEGFLQAVLVAPVANLAIVLGKIMGGATIALAQGCIFLALAPLIGLKLTFVGALWLILVMAVVSVGVTGLGFLVAWPMDSTAGFHAIMNLFLIPLWFLSGALFPAEGAPRWFGWIMKLNPLSYGLIALRQGLYWDQAGQGAAGTSKLVSLGVSVAFAVVMFWASALLARRTTRGDLQ